MGVKAAYMMSKFRLIYKNTLKFSANLYPMLLIGSSAFYTNPRVRTGFEKYLNLEGFLEKSLKIKSAMKNTGKSLKSLEKSLNSTIFCRTKHC